LMTLRDLPLSVAEPADTLHCTWWPCPIVAHRVELWVRPTWRAADLFPLDFAAREAREPVKMPANTRARIREMEEQKARRAKHERQLQVDEKIAADTALWRKDREARRQRQEREAAREQEIQRRVRAEMDN
jgi:hypothetical protein